MIKVCLHSENLSTGAMTHSIRNIAKHINKEEFEVFLASADDGTCYYPEVAKQFKPENIFLYKREPGWMYQYDPDTGEYPLPVEDHPLFGWLEEKKIDIVHDNRGGQAYFPLNSPHVKAKKIESNIFAGYDGTEDIAKTLCISKGVLNDWQEQMNRRSPHLTHRGVHLYPAVSLPETEDNMREELGISEDTIVVGRFSNAGRGDTANFEAYARVETDKTVFLTPNITLDQKEFVKKLGIKNVHILPTLITYYDVSRFYNTLDIAVHNRGESFGGFVAEAHIHGVPVITHGWSRQQWTPATGQ